LFSGVWLYTIWRQSGSAVWWLDKWFSTSIEVVAIATNYSTLILDLALHHCIIEKHT